MRKKLGYLNSPTPSIKNAKCKNIYYTSQKFHVFALNYISIITTLSARSACRFTT